MTRAAQLLEERSRLLLDLTHDAVFVGDMDGRISYWNRGAEELFGWTADEALGQVAHELLETVWPEPFADIAARLLRTDRWQGELAYTRRDGTHIAVATRWALQRDTSGNPVAHFVTANDVTERKQAAEALRKSEEQWRAVFEHNPTMYFMIDPAGTVLSVNRFGAQQLGYGVEELVGHPVFQVFHEADRDAAQRHIAACLEQFDRPMSWELRKVRKGGTMLWVRQTARAMRRADGDSVVLIAGEDITEAKRAQAGLEFFKHVTDQTHDPVFWQNPADGFRFVYVNEAACRHFGRSTEELRRMSVPDVDPNYPLAEMQKHWEELKRRRAITIETVNRRASGEIVPVEVTTNYVVFDGQEYVAGTIRDISERKRAEDALRASEARFRTLVDHATDAFGLCDEHGILVDVNRQACESLGYRREELIGMSASDVDPDVDVDAMFKRFDAGEQILTFESRHRRKDGTLFPVEVRARHFVSPEGRPLVFVLARDITERKRAEEALRESEEHYRALIEVSPQMVWMAQADGSNIYFNQRWYEYTGLTQAESEGLGWARIVHPEHRDRTVDLWLQAAASGTEWTGETPLRRAADGQYRWHFSRGLPIRDADGRIVRWVGVAIDIHDRRETEEALRRSEAYLADAQKLSHTGSWVMNLGTRRVIYWSEELFRMFGFDREEGIPSTGDMLQRIHPDDRARVLAELQRAVGEKTGFDLESRVLLPDGTIRYLHTVCSPTVDAAGDREDLIGTVMDITERRHADDALQNAQAALTHVTRVTTLGEVTASFAHELNQPLAAIVNNANACIGLLPASAPNLGEIRDALADIVSDAERASAVIERVRGLAKRSTPEHVPLRLSDVVAFAATESIARGIAIRTDVPAELPAVLGDRVQLQQVLLNLVVNAMDAMSGADDPERSLDVRGRVDRLDGSPAVTISVEDRGVGFQPEELDRLFEAFYTTKPHGMGLGLAISRSIIEAHGGRLWGESQRGHGAVFSFRLPPAEISRTA